MALPPLGARTQLALSAAMFGIAFVPAQRAVRDLSPFGAVAIRFVVAAVVVVVIDRVVRARRSAEPRPAVTSDARRTVLIAGVLAGGINVVGFCVLSLALERTSASNAAFLSSMSVVIIPVVAVIIGVRRVTPAIVVGVLLAVAGSFLLSGATLSIGTGDALAILDAFIAAGHIAVVGYFAGRIDPGPFNLVQLCAAAVFSIPLVLFGGVGSVTAAALGAAVLCGVLQAAALGLQVRGQAGMDATSAAVILLLVPVLGAVTAMVVLGDRFDLAGVIGAVAILAAVVVAEVLPALGARRQPLVADPVSTTPT